MAGSFPNVPITPTPDMARRFGQAINHLLNTNVTASSKNVTASTYGTFETAAAWWSIANNQGSNRPQVDGFTSPSQIATYADRDSVAAYVSNLVPAPTQTVAAVSFTSNTVVLASAASSSVVAGMIVDTNDATKYSGQIIGISSDRLTLTVSGWFLLGNTAAGQVPTGTPTLYINPCTKAWALNANIELNGSSFGSRASGFELGVLNNKGALTYGDGGSGGTGGVNLIWGYDAVNLGTYQGGVGYICRGNFLRSYVCKGAAQYGYCVEDTSQNPAAGFVSEATTGKHSSHRPGGVEKYFVDTDGSVHSNAGLFIGDVTAANGWKMLPVTTGNAATLQVIGVDASANGWIGAGAAAAVLGFGGTALGNDGFRVQGVSGGVNQLRAIGAATTGDPLIQSGGETNVGMSIRIKGTGIGKLADASGINKVQWSAGGLGFFGTAPIVKPAVTGSRGGNAALASLLTQLAALGLITDSTTA